MTHDRLPPHSPEAETATLSCVLQDPKECLSLFRERFKADADPFYDLRNDAIANAMMAVQDSGQAVDTITLQENLKKSGLLDQVGGTAYISQLYDIVSSPANMTYYLDILEDKWLLRRLVRTCAEVVGRVYDYEGEASALIDEVEREVLAVRLDRTTKSKDIKTLVRDSICAIEEMHNRRGAIDGLPTGFHDYDKLTGGLHPGEMTVWAAYPGVGKTSLLLNVAEHVCVDEKLPVLLFSLEMSAEQLALRMLCSRARVNLRNVRDGFLAERDFPKLTGAAGKIANSLLFIEAIGDLSIFQIRAKARRHVQQHGVKMIGLDYMQLVDGGKGKQSETRENEVARVSKQTKAMAMELRLPVIGLSQLNDDGKLRESRAIGQDADNVGVLKRQSDDDESDAVAVDLHIKKQRNGPTDTVHLTFLRPYTRFESAAKISDRDMPYNQSNDP